MWYYSNNYTVTQKIKVTDPSITTVKGSVEFQACQEGACVPGEKDFAIELGNKGADKATVAAADETKDAPRMIPCGCSSGSLLVVDYWQLCALRVPDDPDDGVILHAW